MDSNRINEAKVTHRIDKINATIRMLKMREMLPCLKFIGLE